MRQTISLLIRVCVLASLVFGIDGLDRDFRGSVAVGAELVHRWAFDGDTTDSSGSGNHGDTFGSISYTNGIVGQALVLDDLDDLVENENANNLPIEPDDLWSLNVWYNLELFPSLAYGGGFGGRLDDTRVRSFLSFGPGGGGEDNAFYFWGSNIDVYAGEEYDTDGQWHMYTITFDGEFIHMYEDGGEVLASDVNKQGRLVADEFLNRGPIEPVVSVGGPSHWNQNLLGAVDEFTIWLGALSDDEVLQMFNSPGGVTAPALRAGDADQDLDFDQLDLVRVQIAGKYLSGAAATWGDGDWDGAPGGSQGNPPAGNRLFDQIDIISALTAATYLTGPYAAIVSGGTAGDSQTSVGYEPSTGRLFVDAPAGIELTSINIDSAAGIFTGDAAQNLGGSFDNDADNNIFKATFGSSFGSISFGNVVTAGLSSSFLMSDLTVVGSLAGGGSLGNVDLIYVPEPSALMLLCAGMMLAFRRRRRQ